MKNLLRLIRRFAGLLMLSVLLLLAVNVVVLWKFTEKSMTNGAPYTMAAEAARALRREADGYAMDTEIEKELESQDIWAVFVEEESREVVWETENVPADIPHSYTLSEVSWLTRGYLNDYPTYTGEREDGLLILGYPKDSFWKHMYPSYDYDSIISLPRTALAVLAVNVAVLFFIYLAANRKMMASLGPLAEGIQRLPRGEPVHVQPRGLLGELAESVNTTSEVLETQRRQLRRKEKARGEWIAGVSHDIRTPLTMIIGYADQLQENPALSEKERKKAGAILHQGQRIRDLVSDLNLVSRLEYQMQPLKKKEEYLVPAVRQAVADFLNLDVEGRYPLEWNAPEEASGWRAEIDAPLIQRAVGNLLQNVRNHNEEGCAVRVSLLRESMSLVIRVEDGGKGMSPEETEALEKTPHYMQAEEADGTLRHGLGLLTVRQTARAHGGELRLGKSSLGGFRADILLPALS